MADKIERTRSKILRRDLFSSTLVPYAAAVLPLILACSSRSPRQETPKYVQAPKQEAPVMVRDKNTQDEGIFVDETWLDPLGTGEAILSAGRVAFEQLRIQKVSLFFPFRNERDPNLEFYFALRPEPVGFSFAAVLRNVNEKDVRDHWGKTFPNLDTSITNVIYTKWIGGDQFIERKLNGVSFVPDQYKKFPGTTPGNLG